MDTRYTVFVDDNYHSGGESERYRLGEFDDYPSAISACERIVDEFLVKGATGIPADELLRSYKGYGEDPWITPDGPGKRFSAWTHAERRCRELAGGLWWDGDAAAAGAFTASIVTPLTSIEIGHGLGALHEAGTFGGVEGFGLHVILRLRDGTSLLILRPEAGEPVRVTVVLPREHARQAGDQADAERRVRAVAGLLGQASPDDRAVERIGRARGAGESRLSLAGLGLTELPAELWDLRGLVALDLSDNWLTELPAGIGRLAGLEELELAGNRLASLPPEIGNLARLRSLSAGTNHLTALPDEIHRLQALETLALGANTLTVLPAGITRLGRLRILRLSKNRLERLPGEMGSLSRLEVLELDRNRRPLPGTAIP